MFFVYVWSGTCNRENATWWNHEKTAGSAGNHSPYELWISLLLLGAGALEVPFLGPNMFTLQEHQMNTLASQNCCGRRVFQPVVFGGCHGHWSVTLTETRFGWGWIQLMGHSCLSEWNLLYHLAGGFMKRRRKTASWWEIKLEDKLFLLA